MYFTTNNNSFSLQVEQQDKKERYKFQETPTNQLALPIGMTGVFLAVVFASPFPIPHFGYYADPVGVVRLYNMIVNCSPQSDRDSI